MYRGKVPALYVTPDRGVPAHSSNRRKMQAADVPPEPLTPGLWCVLEGMQGEESFVLPPVPVFRVRTTASFGSLQGKTRKKVEEFHRYGSDPVYWDSCLAPDWAERSSASIDEIIFFNSLLLISLSSPGSIFLRMVFFRRSIFSVSIYINPGAILAKY